MSDAGSIRPPCARSKPSEAAVASVLPGSVTVSTWTEYRPVLVYELRVVARHPEVVGPRIEHRPDQEVQAGEEAVVVVDQQVALGVQQLPDGVESAGAADDHIRPLCERELPVVLFPLRIDDPVPQDVEVEGGWRRPSRSSRGP